MLENKINLPLFQCSGWGKASEFPYNQQVTKILPAKLRKHQKYIPLRKGGFSDSLMTGKLTLGDGP